MSPSVDRFVVTRMFRVHEGDDEALNALVFELRPLALELVPRDVYQVFPADHIAFEATAALYEALMLWQPKRGPFVVALERRVKGRFCHLALRAQDLEAATKEVSA